MTPRNLSDRISHNPPPALLTLATEATPWGIAQASPVLLNRWAAEILAVAEGDYWRQVAGDLRSLALERSTGVDHDN